MIEVNAGLNSELVNFAANPVDSHFRTSEDKLKRNWLFVALGLIASALSMHASAEIPPGRQVEILYLLKHDCGSCHGMRLEGGLGPALLAKRFTGWNTDTLAMTILFGRPGTPMPPWRPFLTDSEAYWLATQLKQGVRP